MRAKSKRRGHGTPTLYAGVTFRSSLESAWARRFDLLGVAWNYEPVRIRLRATGDNYTPDFGLPAYRAYVEVKPREPYEVEFDRAAEAAAVLGGGVYFLCGSPRAANFWASRNMGEGWYFVPVTVDGLPFPVEPSAASVPRWVVCENLWNPVEECDMSWTIPVSNKPAGGGDYEKAPAGNHPAVLVAIVDMGRQWQEPFKNDPKSKGGFQHRAYFVWELVTKKQSGSSRNHVIAIDLTVSTNEKAKMRKWVEARRGKPIPEGTFDVTAELGQPCLLNVVEKNGYPKIEGVSAIPEGLPVPPAQNKPFAWRIETAMDTKRIDLPTWMPYLYGQPIGDVIKKAEELVGIPVEVVNSPNTAPAPVDAQTPAPAGNGSPARSGPPPRSRGPVPEESFYLDAGDLSGIPTDVLYPASKIKAMVNEKPTLDWGAAMAARDGGEWEPLSVLVPEAAKAVIPF